MKKLICLFILLSSNLWASTPLEQANKLYFNEKYDEAIQVYESILANKQHSVAVYFNLANAHYKLNHIAPSIYYYEKALILNPLDKDAQNNLAFAQAMTIDEIKPIPQVGFVKLVQQITGYFHYNTWAWITVSLSIFTLLLFVGYYLFQHTTTKRILFIVMILSVLLLSVSVMASLFEKEQFEKEQPAILFSESTELREEPKTESESVLTLHEGTKVYILEKHDSWSRVALLNGSEGWVASNSIKAIK